MPDRWGRNLMLRAERRAAREGKRTARSLWEGDYLVGMSDVARQGALRVWSKGVALAPDEVGVPRETDLPMGLGPALLADAIARPLGIADAIGSKAIVVDPASDGARSFYTRYGFASIPGTKRMYLPLKL